MKQRLKMTDLYVLDASAVLAFLRDEPGGERVERELGNSIISTVNLSEIAAKLSDFGMPAGEVSEALSELAASSIVFDTGLAIITGALRKQTRAKGLSLADRACLALAQSTGRIAMTTDRAWADLDVDVMIEVIR
jgi:ribonuclease VapC